MLLDPAQNVIDEVDASTGWPAGINDTKATMERVSAQESGSNPANWQTNNGITVNGLDANATPLFGTPRAKNSASP